MKRDPVPIPVRRWFQEPMVWMVIAIPATAVVVGMLMLSLSVRHYDGLVADDYYKRGQEINRSLERDQQARQYAISAKLQTVADEIVLDLHHDGRLVQPATLDLHLFHRTRTGRDHSVVLTAGPDGFYRGALGGEISGRFVVQLESTKWRVSGEIEWPFEGIIRLHGT